MTNPIKAYSSWQDSLVLRRINNCEKNQWDLKILIYFRIAVISVLLPSILIFFVGDFGLYKLLHWDGNNLLCIVLLQLWILNWLSEAILFRRYVSET